MSFLHSIGCELKGRKIEAVARWGETKPRGELVTPVTVSRRVRAKIVDRFRPARRPKPAVHIEGESTSVPSGDVRKGRNFGAGAIIRLRDVSLSPSNLSLS